MIGVDSGRPNWYDNAVPAVFLQDMLDRTRFAVLM